MLRQPRRRIVGPEVDRVPRHVSRRVRGGHPAGGFLLRAVLQDRLVAQLLLVRRGTPAAVDDELDPLVCRIGRGLAQGTEERRIELGDTRNPLVEDRHAVGDGTAGLAKRTAALTASAGRSAWHLAKRTRALTALASIGGASVEDEDAGNR